MTSRSGVRIDHQHHSSMHIVSVRRRFSDVFVQQQRLANIFDLGNGTLEVKCLGQDDFEDL